jgi:hypothetical protein
MSGLEDEKKDEKRNTARMTDNRMVKLARNRSPNGRSRGRTRKRRCDDI